MKLKVDWHCLPTISFRFLRADASIIYDRCILAEHGKIEGATHPNESAWAIRDGSLTFLDAAGNVTTVFTDAFVDQRGWRLIGDFLPLDAPGYHILVPLTSSASAAGERSDQIGPAEALRAEFDKRDQRLQISDLGGFQSRNIATAHLFMEAIKEVRHKLDSFDLLIQTGDRPLPAERGRHFAYAKRRTDAHITAIPDFIFWYWPEVGIVDYQTLIEQMVAASRSAPVEDKLFWIGNSTMHPVRRRLVEYGRRRADLVIREITWNAGLRGEGVASNDLMKTAEHNYVSLPDHCRYRYLIDVEGAGYSGRLKVLLFSGRVLFVQRRPWEEFFFERLIPYEHYLPVAETLDDLEEKLDWARSHPAHCAQIAASAQKFALQNLTRAAAIEYQQNVLLEQFG
jgi:hypothetical protein